jgi:hypothetical protein
VNVVVVVVVRLHLAVGNSRHKWSGRASAVAMLTFSLVTHAGNSTQAICHMYKICHGKERHCCVTACTWQLSGCLRWACTCLPAHYRHMQGKAVPWYPHHVTLCRNTCPAAYLVAASPVSCRSLPPHYLHPWRPCIPPTVYLGYQNMPLMPSGSASKPMAL